MAQEFNEAGLPSVALDGETDGETRIEAVRRLRRGELRAIFTVDIFNEGIDIPEVDTILLLRPTEAPRCSCSNWVAASAGRRARAC